MHAFKTKGPLLTKSGLILLCGLLSACGQMGPLTLPQQPAEVAKPEQINPTIPEPITEHSTGERSGPL